MRTTEWPTLRIKVPEGRVIFTTVELDGKQLPCTRVQVDTGDIATRESRFVLVTLTFYANLEVEAEGGTPAIVGLEAVR